MKFWKIKVNQYAEGHVETWGGAMSDSSAAVWGVLFKISGCTETGGVICSNVWKSKNPHPSDIQMATPVDPGKTITSTAEKEIVMYIIVNGFEVF